MVQYKMLEQDREDGVWRARVDGRFSDQLERMDRFDADLAPHGPYRLNPGVFFLKLMRRHSAASAAGLMLSLGHLRQLMAEGHLVGGRGGLRLDQAELDGHYLRSEAFVELVRSGYVGSRDATTEHLRALVEAGLEDGRAVVAAVHNAYR